MPFSKLAQKTDYTRRPAHIRHPVPHPPQSLLAGLLNKVAVPGLNHRDITSPRLTWLPPLLSLILQQQRPGVGTISGAQPATASIHRHTKWLVQHDSYPTKLPLVKKLPLQEEKEGDGLSGFPCTGHQKQLNPGNSRTAPGKLGMVPAHRQHLGGGYIQNLQPRVAASPSPVAWDRMGSLGKEK